MKKYIVKIFIFFAIMISLDVVVGYLSDYLVENAKGGATLKNEYICEKTKEDILIFGSSRAFHHYNPQIIQDSLNMTCYNCGYDACGIITAYGLLRTLYKRYTPKVILYEVTPKFDCLEGDNFSFLGPLKLIYSKSDIEDVFENVSYNEKFKMKSGMYRVNSKFIQLITENVMNRNQTIQGFLPEDRQMDFEPENVAPEINESYDSLKVSYLNKFVELCKNKGISLVFMVSPSYKATNDAYFEYMIKFAEKNNIPFINYYCYKPITENKEFFYDEIHLNRKGADEYTKTFVSENKDFLMSLNK
jgi:hypothetical protein